MNDLLRETRTALERGELTPIEVLDRVETERDAAVVDLLLGALRSFPSMADRADVVERVIAMAKGWRDPSRRLVAIAFLAEAKDPERRIGEALLAIARADSHRDVRRAALDVLALSRGEDPGWNESILALTADPSPEMRAASIRALVPEGDAANRILDMCSDRALEVRVAAYEKVGRLRGNHREDALRTLEDAYAREGDGAASARIVFALARVAREEALPALRRMARRGGMNRPHIEDFVRVLESGAGDWDRILQGKRREEYRRRHGGK